MADTNLFDQGLESSPVTKATPTASGNLFDQGLTGGSGVSASAPRLTSVNVPSSSSNLFDAGAGISNNGQLASAEPAKHLYQDETQPWYKRGFDWLNTPITESIFGLPEDRPGAGGFERGVEHVVSGLTSPLSIALTLGTFGTGGLLESAGMTALKESGEFGAEELPQILKAAQTAVDTYKAAPEGATAIADAVKAAGVDPALWNRAQSYLYDHGLSEHDLLGGNFLERGAFQVLHKTAPDLPVAATVRAAKTANTLLNTGFTLQQLESASAMSPRFLDALKEGDYDKAAEYGTEVFASGTLGILGTSHALHSAGELFKPLIENDAFRPNDHWLQIDRANKEREAQHAEAEQQAINLDRSAREILGHAEPGFLESVFGGSEEAKNRKNLELATVFHNIVTGGDRIKAAQWYNSLADALGWEANDPRRIRIPGEPGPNNGQLPAAAPNEDVQKLANNYVASAGIEKPQHEGLLAVDPEAAKKVADAYEKMEHNPDDPKTKAAYDALIRETKAQWNAAKAAGYTLEPWNREGQPYANSREMAEDVRNNKHLYYFQGGDVPESHPLSGIDPETGETYNNIFRAVHDLFGHAKNGYEFGPRGEENAFLAHSRMYSDEAIPALLTETKGQNSWVNFGGHLRDENGNIPKKGESGYIPPTQRPYAEQKAGLLPSSIVNPYLQKEPTLGEPLEQVPTREGTKIVHSNDAGEIRMGADGRPVVWLTPGDWDTFRKSNALPKIAGASFSPEEAEEISSNLSRDKQIQDLFDAATKTSPQGLLTTGRNNVDVQVASEELHHTWQRELSRDGEISNLLKTGQWARLYDIIPPDWQKEMDADGYHEDPIVRVAETAAQFRSGKAKGIIPDTDIVRFLDAFYKEIEARHGKNAVEAADKINDIAAQHIKDINENRRERSATEANELADKAAERRKLSGLEAGRQAGTPEVGSGEPPEGLASREEEQEFGKLSRLRLRGGMGDPNSAGLITGDNEVLVGRYHDDLAKQAGYKEPKSGGNIHDAFFRDGGVRIRGAGGTIHIDFMDPNADTFDRVYQAIQSVPDANRYYVDFRPQKGARAVGFNISAYDKDNLLFQLKDLEDGRQSPPAPVGSVAYFRNGMFSREGDFRDKEPRFPGLRPNGSRTWEEIKPFLNEEVTKHDTPEKQEALTTAFNSLPDHQDYVEAIKAGRAGQMWYERSSRAFDALMDAGIDGLTKKDKPKFLNFVAALSPVQPVRSNLLMALNLWGKWDKAGRPVDVEWKNGIPNKNASLYRILKGRGNTQGVDLPARMNNAIRALQGEPLSGPKVSAFTTNLGKDVNRVTNDTWMAVFGGHDPNRINKPAVYDAMSAKIREAADATGIAPRQAQAAVWSFIKSLAELSGWGNDRWIPPQEIIRQRLLSPELVGMHSADFADLIQNDPEIRDAIKAIGGDLNALDKKLKTYVPGKPTEGGPAEPNPQLLNAAERLEGARRDARIANHLARKQEGGLFDTEFSPNNGLFARERENETPQWYLKSNQLIDQRMQGPMPADTVLKMLENNGVKPDELKYTGLADLLHEKGKEPIRPEELKKFLDANNLQIQEVNKGGDYGNLTPEQLLRKESLEDRQEQGEELSPDQLSDLHTLQQIASRTPETKFGAYQLPGGQNYREMLLTLPEKPGGGEPAYRIYDEHGTLMGSKDGVPTQRQLDAQASTGWKIVPYTKEVRPEPKFTSSHWDESNVVGHVRFNDRTGPNGEKLLHLEELQSDWHQKGRKEGYRSETPITKLPEGYSVRSVTDKGYEDLFDVIDPRGRQVASGESPEDATASALETLNLHRNTNTVPDAPFKKTWPELLMKRMIRYAAENGYDGISWTPGEEQAARYDLSKQIEAVSWDTENGDVYIRHKGRRRFEPAPIGEARDESALADLIGKEAARKLVEQQPTGWEDDPEAPPTQKRISGVDLKVGGEGMKGFYDKIVPDYLNKFGKQFGAKVGETKIDVAPQHTYPGNGLPFEIQDEHGRPVDGYATRDEAEFELRAWPRGYKIVEAGRMFKPDQKTVPYFPITDSMRESVMKQGQPLFARESPNNGQLQHQIDTNVFKNQPKDYQDLVMESLRRNAVGDLSDREIKASKKLREEDGRNYEIGSSNDLIHSFLENHLHRIYEDDNPKGRVILSNAKAGNFATAVTQARHQVYDSQLTALLKSPKRIMLDPVKAVSLDRENLIKAAANRQLIDSLRDKFTRASDGRPAVVLSGAGQVITGPNGEDPRIYIDKNRVRDITINPKVVEQLTASGDLQRYLDKGTIRDITPYVRPNNIGAAIDRLEEQAGKITPRPDEHGQNPLRTQIMLLKSMQNNGDFSGLKGFNDALEKKYAWDPQDYVSLANNALKGWNFITNSPDGTPVFVRSDIKVHPEFAEYLQNRLGLAPSEISKHPIGKALLGAGSKLKQTLLSLSPFHMVQEALRGIMVGVNPFHITGPDILSGERINPADPNSPTIIRKAVENGFTTGTDYKSLQEHSEGLSSGGGILDKIPGVGKVIGNSLNFYQDFLFRRYIPALKARSVELMYHEYQRLHPDWSVDRIAKAAATHTNEAFGGINWRAMGRSATTQDWGRLIALAPDWLESEMRSGARLFNKDEGSLGRAQVAKMALGLWGIARVLNLLTTGNPHLEAPFGLATKNKEGKETLFSIRTLPTDLLHAASDPVGFIKGRLSPTVRLGTELVTQRDQYGRKLQPQDLWVDVFRNMSPIPLQSLGQAMSGTGPEVGNIGQTVKALGGTATTYRTPAQKMAADLAADRTESGPVDPAQLERHRRIIQIEDQARAGEISWPDLYKLAYATDQIHPDELKKIETNIKETKGMDPGLAALYSRASRLPAKEYLDLLDVMNNSEKAALAPLTLKVQKRYLNASKKNMTPEERAKDPTFQRFLSLIPMRPAVNQ
jgi:hypothetical protein